MLSQAQIDAILKQKSNYRPASKEEKELFFLTSLSNRYLRVMN